MDRMARLALQFLASSQLWGVCISLAILLAAAIQPSASPASAQVTTPSLRVVRAAGYRLAVEGRGWPHLKRLSFSVRAGPWLVGLELRTTRRGLFRVGVNNLDRCGTGLMFVARDFAGHVATLGAPSLLCPAMADPPAPVLALLLGRALHPAEVRSIAPTGPDSVTLYRGDLFYLWEPGKDRPAFSASADQKYLSPIRQGKSAAPGCTQSCDPGFYWEWTAIRTGDTSIDLSPGCRQSTPPCEAPDIRLSVHILG